MAEIELTPEIIKLARAEIARIASRAAFAKTTPEQRRRSARIAARARWAKASQRSNAEPGAKAPRKGAIA